MHTSIDIANDIAKAMGVMGEIALSGVIFGHLPSGKNNYRIGERGMFKNQKVLAYEQIFYPQMNLLKTKAKYKLEETKRSPVYALVANIFFRDMRRDVDTILFCDLLQKSGVIGNDRSIRVKILFGVQVDPKNPRIEFILLKLKEAPNEM